MINGCTYLLVVDGLDESEDNDVSGVPREKALNMLSRLCLPNGNHTFKIIALSRNETVIKRHISTRYFLDMKDMNERDIEQIIDADIKRMWKKIRHSADLPSVSSEDHPDVYESDKKHYKLDVIRQRLIDHADGVILWVVLVLRELGALFEDPSCTPTRILKALDKIPENLEDLYEDMFVRLRASPTRSHAKAALLFTWLLFAQSTLKVCEVRDIIAMFNWRISDPSTTDHDNLANHRNMQSNDNWQPTKRLLEDLCGGFVEVIPQNRLSSGTSPSDYAVKPGDSVQLIHQTAREFLLDPKSELKSTGALGTVDDIRWICVNYLELIFDSLLPTSPAHEALEHMVRQLQESPLMGYILRTFPKIMDMQPSTRGDESGFLRQRVVDFANNAEQNRWSSLTWWLLRPWIERLFARGAYKLEDPTPEELISVLKPEDITSDLLRRILRISVVDDEVTSATRMRGDFAVMGEVVPGVIMDLGSIESSLVASLDVDAISEHPGVESFSFAAHADEMEFLPLAPRFPRRGHLCAMRWRRYHHQAGLINKYFLLYAIFCAKKIGCSIALDILVAASSDSSGSPDATMLSVLRLPWAYEDAGESVAEETESCMAALPFRDMADQCAHHQSKKDYIENWRDCIEEDVEEDVAEELADYQAPLAIEVVS
ncbi:hypothetical protein CTRI78_v005779 [Colletotrichum trifolii]|uniref:NACHT domain-containing protein n=1 Tax=Colletotrichum trifolii TaxID=5466 RepID=A0A4R8RKQ2_COLTR|nr:hypothetical protein CTRI78_v005779 [Colletotrichum trifolii]